MACLKGAGVTSEGQSQFGLALIIKKTKNNQKKTKKQSQWRTWSIKDKDASAWIIKTLFVWTLSLAVGRHNTTSPSHIYQLLLDLLHNSKVMTTGANNHDLHNNLNNFHLFAQKIK